MLWFLLESSSAFRAELRRMVRIFRLPAAIFTDLRSACRFWGTAVLTEFSGVDRSAGAYPLTLFRFRLSAF